MGLCRDAIGNMTKRTRQNIAAAFLLAIGLTTMTGEVFGNRALKGIGAASAVAPFPKVFCDLNGFEVFASTFILIGETRSGMKFEKQITPEVYAGVRGSYNLRNAYGAALSYAPRLPQPLWQSVAHDGFRAGGPLRRELEIPDDLAQLRLRITTQTRGRDDVWELELPLP